MRRFRFPILVAVLVFVATGCIRSDLTVSVNDDGSGTYSAIVAFNPKAMASLAAISGQDTGALGQDPCKEMRDSAAQNKGDLPTGAKVENYTDGDFCGIKITAPFAAGENPSAEISKTLGGMDSATEGVTGVGLDSFSITKSGNGWVFAAAPTGTDTGSASTASEAEMMKGFLQGASSIVRIKLPGRVVEADSNPDKIDGDGVLIWNLDLTGETRTLKARTEAGDPIKNKTYTDAGKSLPNIKGAGGATSSSNATSGGTSGGTTGGDDGGSSTLPLIIGALVVVAAIVGFVLWRKAKGGATPAPTGPPIGGLPGGYATPAGPPTGDATATWGAAPTDPSAVATGAGTATALADPPGPSSAEVATPAAAIGQPQWDAARNAYILWDAASSKWLQYDNAAGAWKPIE